MATTLQKIETPKRWRAWDTSGNNNHGQIYSGRGLEFDGVTDYLSVSSSRANVAFGSFLKTFACWAKFDDASDEQVIGAACLSMQSVGVKDGKIATSTVDGDDDIGGTTVLQDNTWYRLVWVINVDVTDTAAVDAAYADGFSNADFYINGVKETKEAANFFRGSTEMLIGARKTGSDYNINFAGKMSDVQLWDTAWTAEDAAFDYANPEQLALNRGGTSLTNSNLKLWYPMNDGHRGQQSYVLDASNVGLADVTSSLTSWSTGADVFETLTSSGLDVTSAVNSSGNGRMVTNSGITCAIGDVFKITFDVTFNGGQIQGPKLKIGTSGSDLTTTLGFITESNSYTYYLNCIANGTGGLFFFTDNTSTDFSMNNIKVYRVNNKNHATTVFYGDMTDIATDSDAQYGKCYNTANTKFDFTTESTAFSGGDGYDVVANSAFTATNSTCLIETDNSSTGLEIKNSGLAVGSMKGEFTVVVGRTYQVDLTMYAKTESFVDADLGISLGTSSGGTQYSNANSATDSVSQTFTATSTALHLTVYVFSATSGHAIRIKTLQIREVGTASGWTDADQQLDIPQTALQSYNQLAWFDGATSDVTATVSSTTGDSDFSISAWINLNLENGGSQGLVRHGGGYADSAGWTIYFNASGAPLLQYNPEGDGSPVHNGLIANSTSLAEDKWHHVVGTFDRDGEFKFYTNGERNGDAITLSEAATDISNGTTVYIGSVGGSSYNLDGCITEVSYWKNHVLSQSDINELYNDGKALNALEHSAYLANNGRLLHYWRNNGLASWQDLKNSTVTTYNATPNDMSETILQQAGVDASRDCQGFLMNRQKDTNALNLAENDYATVDVNHAFGTDNFSYSCWFKIEDGELGYLVGVGVMGASDITGLIMDAGGGKIRSRPFGVTAVYTSSTYDDGEWHYAHHNIDRSGNAILYIDNSAVITQDISAQSGTSFSTDAWNVGFEITQGNYLAGNIDEFQIYSRILTTDEIDRNYKAGKRSHK